MSTIGTRRDSCQRFGARQASDHKPLLRTIELYEADRLDFADAYVCASAETSGIGKVASFDRRIDGVKSIERLEP